MKVALDNVFFQVALRRAKKVLGSKGRLIELLGKVAVRLTKVKWKEVDRQAIVARFQTLLRLLKAYATGRYREIPWKALLLITGAVIYFLMPVDLIPDFIPGLGLTDDLGILAAVYQAANNHLEAFIAWEKNQPIPIETPE